VGALIARDGTFASPIGFAAADASGTVTFAGATRAGLFRTVEGFGPTPPVVSDPVPIPPSADGPPAPAPGATPSPPAPSAGVPPAPAPAAPAPVRTQPQPAAQRAVTVTVAALGRRALALVHYPWRRLGYRLVFAPGR